MKPLSIVTRTMSDNLRGGMSSPLRLLRENLRGTNGVKGMIKLGISYTGARQVTTAAIAALMLCAGACKADELGPRCKQYLQLKQQ